MSVDSDSASDIGYETDITKVDADIDVDEGGNGDGNHDINDFAELVSDNEHPFDYPTDRVVPLPQPTMASMEQRRKQQTT